MRAPKPTPEQYSLFRDYLDARHPDGGMADMSVLDYSMMVEDSHIDTFLTEYRRRGPDTAVHGRGGGPLIAACLTDRLSDGLSLVYSFYDPALPKRSLGAYIILDHIEKARRMGLPHVYLGYWVEGSHKMAYKGAYLPQERLGLNGWTRVEREMSHANFVSTDWLDAHLGDADLRVIDASWHLPTSARKGDAEFRAGHIPGAVFFNIDAIADTRRACRTCCPTPAAFARAMGELGLGDGMRFVIYDSLGLFAAARVWWTLRAFGAKDVFILEGGLPKWIA